ncbi:MAG: hypothetical protein AAFQ21_15995 [Pseudomonadota bacterium]
MTSAFNAQQGFQDFFANEAAETSHVPDTAIYATHLHSQFGDSAGADSNLADFFDTDDYETTDAEWDPDLAPSLDADSFDLAIDPEWASLFAADVTHTDCMREAVPGFVTLNDAEIDSAIEVMLAEATPEQIESFWKKLKSFGKRIAGGLGKVVRTVAPIAGRVVGGVFGGPAGARIGGRIGGVAGNLVGSGLSRVSQRRRGSLRSRRRFRGGQIYQRVRRLAQNPYIQRSLGRAAGLVGRATAGRPGETLFLADQGPVYFDAETPITDSDVVETMMYLQDQLLAEDMDGETMAPYRELHEAVANTLLDAVENGAW